MGATLVSPNSSDLSRIVRVFSFDFVVRCPSHAYLTVDGD
jgi:hypothetical protein